MTETGLYDADVEVQSLIDWICVSEQIKENNNIIRNLIGEYKKERNNLYEKQNDLKGQKWRIEKSLER